MVVMLSLQSMGDKPSKFEGGKPGGVQKHFSESYRKDRRSAEFLLRSLRNSKEKYRTARSKNRTARRTTEQGIGDNVTTEIGTERNGCFPPLM